MTHAMIKRSFIITALGTSVHEQSCVSGCFLMLFGPGMVLRSGCLSLLLSLFFVEFPFFLGGGVLVLLVLGHQVVHVGLGLGELHLVHTLASVPVEESLAPEHGGELLGDAPC